MNYITGCKYSEFHIIQLLLQKMSEIDLYGLINVQDCLQNSFECRSFDIHKGFILISFTIIVRIGTSLLQLKITG